MRMKPSFVVVAAIAAVLGAGPLLAQSSVIQADIPFAFIASGQTMPAGTYTINTPSPNLALIRSVESGGGVFEMFERGTLPLPARNDEVKLIFHRYGKTYFLAKVENGLSGAEFLFERTKAEKELAKAAALRGPEETVIVLARLR